MSTCFPGTKGLSTRPFSPGLAVGISSALGTGPCGYALVGGGERQGWVGRGGSFALALVHVGWWLSAAVRSRPILAVVGRIGLYPLHADDGSMQCPRSSSLRVRGWPLQRNSVPRETDSTLFCKAVHVLSDEGDLFSGGTVASRYLPTCVNSHQCVFVAPTSRRT